MPRVVCPLCRTGFEANISRENIAINCVSCNVAFNAAHFLSRDDFSAKAERRTPQNGTPLRNAQPLGTIALGNVIRPALPPQFAAPASEATRTCGLPFMSDDEVPPAKEPVAPPKAEAPKPKAMLENVQIEKCADECPSPPPAPKIEAAEAAPRKEEEKRPAPAAKVKKSRRPLLEGSFGPYDIESEIARGGVGAVFRARERGTGRLVALKVLLEGDEAGESDCERFRHECETAKALSLPGMVQVYAVGELEGRPYMAMELVDGRSLDKIIPEKSLSVNDCLVLMKSVAETIGALHEAGYVHRDLKPGNILIDAFGSPKVADFGLVKSLDEITRMTASGLVCGTPAYMAPEQARGDAKAIDPRSDIWALGAVLYEMLTMKPPFQAENALRLMLRITKDQPTMPRALNLKVPQDVQTIVMKCLEKNALHRYPNGRALAEDISRFLNGEPLRNDTQPKMQRIIAAAANNRRSLVAAGASLSIVLGVLVIARVFFSAPATVALIEKGYAAYGEKSYDNAEEFFRKALAADSKCARAHLGLGLCLGREGIDLKNHRVSDPRKVSEAMAETAHAAMMDRQLSAEAHAQRASFYMWVKRFNDELVERQRAVELAQDNLKYRKELAIAYWNCGFYGPPGSAASCYKRALGEFQTILNADPAYPRIGEYIRDLQARLARETAAVVSLH